MNHSIEFSMHVSINFLSLEKNIFMIIMAVMLIQNATFQFKI